MMYTFCIDSLKRFGPDTYTCIVRTCIASGGCYSPPFTPGIPRKMFLNYYTLIGFELYIIQYCCSLKIISLPYTVYLFTF